VHKCRHPRAGSAIYFIAIKRSVPMRLPALLACTRLRSRRSLWAMLHSSMRPGPRHASLTTLISHLECEPQGGLYARGGTPAVRLLFDLVRELTKVADPLRPIPICSWQSMISLAHYLRRPIRRPFARHWEQASH
jgi:hypothetical protein